MQLQKQNTKKKLIKKKLKTLFTNKNKILYVL